MNRNILLKALCGSPSLPFSTKHQSMIKSYQMRKYKLKQSNIQVKLLLNAFISTHFHFSRLIDECCFSYVYNLKFQNF